MSEIATPRHLVQVLRRTGRMAAWSVLSVSAAGAITSSTAQTFPNRPIRLIVSQAAGSSNDILARIVGAKMAESLGQSIVVDTRPGASGVIGTELASKAPPDGHTLLLSSQTVFATLPVIKRRLPFDPDKSFIPLTQIAWVSSVVAVHPSAPSTIAELVQLAKSQPGRFNYGSAGTGSPAHIGGELFNLLAATRITHVPYKGTALAVTDLISGQIQMVITSPLVVLPHANIGRIKIVATTGAKRDPLLPHLPAIAETLPGYDLTQWWGLAAIAGTPRPIVERLHAVAASAINNVEIKEKLSQQGATAIRNSPAEFAALILRERARIADVVKRAGIALED
jgi:tripartite-type tricarboxylate transporter receptor subunit TctC